MTEEPEGGHRKSKKKDDIERHKKIPPRHKGEYVYTPGKTELTQEDIDEAIKEWDKTMPEYKGLLDADIEKGDDD